MWQSGLRTLGSLLSYGAAARLCLPGTCAVVKHTYVVPYSQVTWNHTVQGIGLGDNNGLGQLGTSAGEAPSNGCLGMLLWDAC